MTRKCIVLLMACATALRFLPGSDQRNTLTQKRIRTDLRVVLALRGALSEAESAL